MRLSQSQRDCIRREAQRVFGANARVRLFGSRVDDDRIGGDIDLHIEADGTPAGLLECELQLYASLQRQLGERHIDSVAHGRDTPLRAIDRHALRTGVPL